MEAAIVAPAVVVMVLIVVLGGRIQSAGGVVDAAARAGARAASLERGGTQAQKDAARIAVQAVLAGEHVDCPAELEPVQVGSGPDGLQTVTVVVDCTVQFDRLTLRWVPGSAKLHGQFTSVVDRHRGTG
ncbi:TadE/TadG family type IV pilus assembly protein [Kitasatospora sp. NPDC002227]|uniref:TadE/TadG family type IV pilus assembly protein n=1 Tax=Kitasatospora sp. NPDC002227 TaxID=3154773 RepID=UPI00331B5AAE